MDWDDFFTVCAQALIGTFVVFIVIAIGAAAVGSIRDKK